MPDRRTPRPLNLWLTALLSAALVVGSYAVSKYSYVLFHTLVELFGIAVGAAIFMIAWNARRFVDNGYLSTLGVAYLFVSIVATLHTLAYKGVNVFYQYDSNLPTQLYLIGKYLLVVSFLLAPLNVHSRKVYRWLLPAYAAVTSLLVGSAFARVFPLALVEGRGLTPFKVDSEYVAIAFLAVALLLLWREREHFDRKVIGLMAAAILTTMLSGFSYSLYTDPYGPANFVGHILQASSFFFVYRALVQTSLEDPYGALFRRLKQREETLARANELSEGLNRVDTEIATSITEFDRVMSSVVRIARETMRSDSTTVSLMDAQGNFTVRYATGPLEDLVGTTLEPERARHLISVAQGQRILLSEDLRTDEAVHPFVSNTFGMSSLMTLPLVAGGESIGALSFHWKERHEASEAEKDFAFKLGNDLSLALENARLFQAEHEVAETLQSGLTSVPEKIAGLELGWVYRAMPGVGRIGGDFFDVYETEPGHIVFFIGDVSGKGIEAAAATGMVRSTLRAYSYVDPDPAVVMRKASRALMAQLPQDRFVTVAYGTMDTSSGETRIAVAGHYDAIIVGRPRRERERRNLPFGVAQEDDFEVDEFVVAINEKVVLFTDGLVEARRGGEVFGEERVRRLLEEASPGEKAAAVASTLVKSAESFAGGDLMDDIAVLVLRLL